MEDMAKFREDLESALLNNDAGTARDIVFTRMAAIPPFIRMEAVIAPVLEAIGTSWQNGDTALVQIYFSSKICEGIVLKLFGESAHEFASVPKIAVATLEDFHQLGAKVVRMSIQSAGQKVIDYGRMDVAALAEKVSNDGTEYLLISTLMLRSALKVEELRKALDSKGCKVKIIVGGAPFRFDWSLWRKVNADFTAASPILALEFIKREEELP
jgi:methanogenic corrinoid protein MtbC1